MTPSVLHPPSEPLWSDVRDRAVAPPPPPPPDPPRPRWPRGRRPLALLLVASALLGGGTSVGVLALAGALGNGGATTTVERVATTTSSSKPGGLNPSALYASTAAGVVDITSKSTSSAPSGPFGGVPQQSQSTATGTGFVVDRQGHIVTAAHVVDGASSVTVKLQDGTTRKATVLGKDDANDIAVLGIDASGLKLHPLTLGSSASVGVGAAVAAIGDPFGYARSLSTGIVSGVDRTIRAPNGFTVAHAIQTDAAMNPGNSGGPVLDANGNVIGIADQIATDGNADQSSGVGFAVPVDLVKSTLKTLESGGRVQHAYLGIGTGDAASGGATLSSVTGGGPASAAGLRAGDVVTSIGGTTVSSANDLVAAVASRKPGDRVTMTVRRGSQTLHVNVTLGTQPSTKTGG